MTYHASNSTWSDFYEFWVLLSVLLFDDDWVFILFELPES